MAPSSGWSVEKEMSIELTADAQSNSVKLCSDFYGVSRK